MQTHFPSLTICKTGKNLSLNSRLREEKCKPKHAAAAAQPPSFVTDLDGHSCCAGMLCIYDCVVTAEDLDS